MQGREIFRLRGCMGCHRYEGFDRDADEISTSTSRFASSSSRRPSGSAKSASANRRPTIRGPATTRRKKLLAHANDLKVRSSGLDAKIEQLDMRSRSLVREVKKVGPSLKEARVKLNKEWIPVWLKDPHQWREGTKMPTFRLDDDEIRAIAAFIWQSGVTGDLPHQNPRRSRRRARKHSKPAAAWPATPWAKARPKQGGTFARI